MDQGKASGTLTRIFQEVTKVIDEARAVGVTCIDFIQAFDKVPHGSLIQKIKMHRIHGDLVVWIQNCLLIDDRWL